MKPGLYCVAAWLITLSGAGAVLAQTGWEADAGTLDEGILVETPLDEQKVAGLITDQTMTRVGRDFMHGFTTVWRGLGGTAGMSVAVYERPSARWGSLIWVEQNFVRVYQAFLYPGRGEPVRVGEHAALLVHRRVIDAQTERMLFGDPDLGKDEF